MSFASVFCAAWVTGIRMAVQMMNWERSGWKWSWDITEINLDKEPKFENYVKFLDNFHNMGFSHIFLSESIAWLNYCTWQRIKKERMERVAIIQIFLMIDTCRNTGRTKHGSAPIAVD
jgi:hypothetical protein